MKEPRSKLLLLRERVACNCSSKSLIAIKNCSKDLSWGRKTFVNEKAQYCKMSINLQIRPNPN